MSPEEQRIAIAEAYGYMQPHFTPSGSCVASAYRKEDGSFWGSRGVPDYLNDLNACREFEKKLIALGPPALDTYEIFLLAICTRAGNRIFRAAAPQRCEAFLKTIGKWEGEA